MTGVKRRAFCVPELERDPKDIPGILDMLYDEEVYAKYASICSVMSDKLSRTSEVIWIYGSREITERILRRSIRDANVKAVTFGYTGYFDEDSVSICNLYDHTPYSAKCLLYRALEIPRNKALIIRVCSLKDHLKLDKRVLSRGSGTTISVGELGVDEYIRIFQRTIFLMRKNSGCESNCKSVSESNYSSDFDWDRIEKKLSQFVTQSCFVDPSYMSMRCSFFKFVYALPPASPFLLLNSLHLALLILATGIKMSWIDAHNIYNDAISSIPLGPRTDANTIHRRYLDLLNLLLLKPRRIFEARKDLEEEIKRRNISYLKLLLEKVKQSW